MDVKRGREVVAQYRSFLRDFPPRAGGGSRQDRPFGQNEYMMHVRYMLDRMEEFLDEVETPPFPNEDSDEAWEKFNRWLGFAQAVLWVYGQYSLDELRDHNRT
ncbi:MAG: hypothetical protein GF334_09005 [Candidatus Altiarchaeales archaeon]|nr:hypothetical protein [Candidatus Altiarchaeales archaeon]